MVKGSDTFSNNLKIKYNNISSLKSADCKLVGNNYVRYNVHIKEYDTMTNTNATALRKNLFSILSNAIKYNEIINVNTKDGNAVIISEEEYNGMKATIELSSDKNLQKKILDGKNTSLEECVNIDEVDW